MDLVDAHTHLFPPAQIAARADIVARDAAFAEIYADPESRMAVAGDLVGALDDASVRNAVVAGFAFANAGDIQQQNEYIADAARVSDSRLVPLATVNPTLPGWEREARRALDAGARGFGELRPANQGWSALGPEGRALCELAREASAVLLWHASEPVGHTYSGKAGGIGPVELIETALAYPDLPMIGAHLGGGAPFYLQMPELQAAIELLYFDISAFSLLYDREAVGRMVDLVGQERLLFASDFPLQTPRRQLERVRGLLSGETLHAVTANNATRLFATKTYD